MDKILKWSAIIFAVIFFILVIVMTVMYFKKDSDKVTKIDLVYSQASNPKLKNATDVTIESYLVEKVSGEIYLVIPGFGTQNKLSWTQLATSAANPSEVKSNTIEGLKGYTVDQTPSQQPGYFNNCGVFTNAEWSLNNGILICKPYIYVTDNSGKTIRSYTGINLNNCLARNSDGTPTNSATPITSSFGASVIKLVKA